MTALPDLTPSMEQLNSRHYRANREADMFARLCVETTLVGDTEKAAHWARRSQENQEMAAELQQQKRDLGRVPRRHLAPVVITRVYGSNVDQVAGESRSQGWPARARQTVRRRDGDLCHVCKRPLSWKGRRTPSGQYPDNEAMLVSFAEMPSWNSLEDVHAVCQVCRLADAPVSGPRSFSSPPVWHGLADGGDESEGAEPDEPDEGPVQGANVEDDRFGVVGDDPGVDRAVGVVVDVEDGSEGEKLRHGETPSPCVVEDLTAADGGSSGGGPRGRARPAPTVESRADRLARFAAHIRLIERLVAAADRELDGDIDLAILFNNALVDIRNGVADADKYAQIAGHLLETPLAAATPPAAAAEGTAASHPAGGG